MLKKYTLNIVDIKIETVDTITICFKQPVLKKIKYIAGQYVTLSFRINERLYNRVYSLSSTPNIDSFLEITIKRIPNGIVSNYIHENIKINDTLEISEPMGEFIFTDNNYISEIYLYGVGSGITPLFSILKHILFTFPSIKVILIYGSKTKEETIFLKKLEELVKIFPDNFIFYQFNNQLSNDSNNEFTRIGRIDKTFLKNFIEKINKQNSLHYICGPIDLKNNVIDILNIFNIPSEHIYSEDFKLNTDSKDFEDIINQKVILNFKGQQTTIEVNKGKNILESALDLGINLPYSCQTGICSTCKAKLKSGKLKMIGLSKERKDLKENEYLMCCSYPLNEGVLIEI